jgi:hypothetical protein
MKKAALLLLCLSLVACAGLLARHRMLAADRKLSDVASLAAAGHWTEAQTRAEGLKGSVVQAVLSRPVQKRPDGQTVDLRPVLTAWESQWQELAQALTEQHPARTEATLTALRQQCVNCHLVLGRPEIQVTGAP